MNLVSILVIFLVALSAKAQVFIPMTFWSCQSYNPSVAVVSRTLRGAEGTQVVSVSQDDANQLFALPFNFTVGTYSGNQWYISSNSYVTGGTGSNNYSGLGPGKPAFNKFHLGAADNSWQRVWTIKGLNYARYRYEGTASTGGTPGSPNIVFEFTFFKPVGLTQYAEVVYGVHNRNTGQHGVANTTSWLVNAGTITANTSEVFRSTDGGATWSVLSNSSIVGNCISY